MNALVKKGYQKPLEEEDIPLLGVADKAGTQHSMFIEKINASQSSLFWAIISCYKIEILVSGFFALLKILTLSAGPLLLREFINVSSGEEAFRHEGKSTLLAAILGEVPRTEGMINVSGKVAYVSQNAWIQSGSVQDNILFGSTMDKPRYEETLQRCSLVYDLENLPFGDLTQVGERGETLSGGQKQRIQLARALYCDADIYLLDDPFSSVDTHTAMCLFNEYVMGALLEKTVLLVTHQIELLQAFNSVLLMSQGQIMHAASYQELLAASKEFQDLVNAHKDTAEFSDVNNIVYNGSKSNIIRTTGVAHDRGKDYVKPSGCDQLIRKEEREIGDTVIGSGSIIFLLFRALLVVDLSLQTSKSLFSQLLSALFHAPMSFFQSTPVGRILSRVSSDLSIVDLDLSFTFSFSICATINAYINLGVLCFFTWQVLFLAAPVIFMSVRLQRYYLASSKELMRISGTTKSRVANHLAESISGAVTIRAFKQEDRFFAKMLEILDNNASPSFHCSAATEWLTQRLEIMSAAILSSSAFVITLLPLGTFSSGVIGMVLSYGLSLNMLFLFAIQSQCSLANQIISVERLSQYMHIVSEAPDKIEDNQLPADWPSVGKIELHDLEIKYNQDASPVLHGITCTFEGGDKIDITAVGLHDLRFRIGLIPQDPILFHGSIRFNLDPQGDFSDEQIMEVICKCQLSEAVKEKQGLDSLVVEGGLNWSMGQRQLLCLGRALLRRNRILILDEATASIDNATDAILQKIISTEFRNSTIITIAHRIPTVLNCTRVLVINDGNVVEYDRPQKLMLMEGSFFNRLLNEYWLHASKAALHIKKCYD
ncbi:hypothetical protein QOZ80_1BG0061610 [Eleusine coracana subsp. coracana]|nr:hypothetical protein QOZ80_1BG0061610 [Eleusine coracana subsp. coracana]